MDDVMNPKRSFKVKSKAHSPQQLERNEDNFSDKGEKVEAYGEDSDAYEGNPPEGDDDNDNDGEVSQSVPRSPSPNRRRSTRTSLRAHIPNYDIK
jgi:hypothetical protein